MNEKIETTKPYNELEATVPMMLSDDYKQRFAAEYRQTKIRYERLKSYTNRIEAAQIQNANGCQANWAGLLANAFGATNVSNPNVIPEPPHDCPAELLREQQKKMGEYLHILEIRAVIEGIEL